MHRQGLEQPPVIEARCETPAPGARMDEPPAGCCIPDGSGRCRKAESSEKKERRRKEERLTFHLGLTWTSPPLQLLISGHIQSIAVPNGSTREERVYPLISTSHSLSSIQNFSGTSR